MLEREIILTNLIGESKIESIQNDIQTSQAGMLESTTQSETEDWIKRYFKDFGTKIVGISNGAETLTPKDVTVLGGWCAIRTRDHELLQEGLITNPETGIGNRYEDPMEVAEWLKDTVSIDQIVESIGILNGSRYTAISEERLWGERVKYTLEQRLRRNLSENENTQLRDSLQEAELKRYQGTERYLQYVTGKKIDITRVVDEDIYDELVGVRDEMLDRAGITLEELLKVYSDNITAGYSIVWGMYTGPYLALLQTKEYVQTPKALIVEPWMHATPDTQTRAYFNQRYFRRNPYLSKNGINKNLGFVVYADVMMPDGKRVRKTRPINGVPNERNYRSFIQCLAEDPNCSNVNLKENPAFIWGANLLPFGSTQKALKAMIDIQDLSKLTRKVTNSEYERPIATELVRSRKEEYGEIMRVRAEQVINELDGLLQFVFSNKYEITK